jgi:hypothetical protein
VVAFYETGTKLYDPATGWRWRTRYWLALPAGALPCRSGRLIHRRLSSPASREPARSIPRSSWTGNCITRTTPGRRDSIPTMNTRCAGRLAPVKGVCAARRPGHAPRPPSHIVLIRYRDPAHGVAVADEGLAGRGGGGAVFLPLSGAGGITDPGAVPIAQYGAACPKPSAFPARSWRDRKLSFWAKAAGDDGGAAEIVMRYFYPMQPGFFFPGESAGGGSHVPLLDLRAGTPGTPIDVHSNTTWPDRRAGTARRARPWSTEERPAPDRWSVQRRDPLRTIAAPDQDRSSVRLIDPDSNAERALAQLPGPDLETRVARAALFSRAAAASGESRQLRSGDLQQLRVGRRICRATRGRIVFVAERADAARPGCAGGLSHQTRPGKGRWTALAAQAADVIDVRQIRPGFDGSWR